MFDALNVTKLKYCRTQLSLEEVFKHGLYTKYSQNEKYTALPPQAVPAPVLQFRKGLQRYYKTAQMQNKFKTTYLGKQLTLLVLPQLINLFEQQLKAANSGVFMCQPIHLVSQLLRCWLGLQSVHELVQQVLIVRHLVRACTL